MPISGMRTDIYELTSYIVTWSNEVHPNRDPFVTLKKLLSEIEELQERPGDGYELADVMILLLDLCHLTGVDIVKTVHWKMKINEGRSWELQADGTIHHKRTIESKQRNTLAYCRYCQDPIFGGTPVECLSIIGKDCITDGFIPDPEDGVDGESSYP